MLNVGIFLLEARAQYALSNQMASADQQIAWFDKKLSKAMAEQKINDAVHGMMEQLDVKFIRDFQVKEHSWWYKYAAESLVVPETRLPVQCAMFWRQNKLVRTDSKLCGAMPIPDAAATECDPTRASVFSGLLYRICIHFLVNVASIESPPKMRNGLPGPRTRLNSNQWKSRSQDAKSDAKRNGSVCGPMCGQANSMHSYATKTTGTEHYASQLSTVMTAARFC